MLLLFFLFVRLICDTTTLETLLHEPSANESATVLPDQQLSSLRLSVDYQEPQEQTDAPVEEAADAFLQDLECTGVLTALQGQKSAGNFTGKDVSCYNSNFSDNMFDAPYKSVIFIPYTSPIYYWFPQKNPEHVLMARRAVIGHGNIIAGRYTSPNLRKAGVAGHGGVAVLKPQSSRSSGLRTGFLGHAGGIGYIGRQRTRDVEGMVVPGDVPPSEGSQEIDVGSPYARSVFIIPGRGPQPYHLGTDISASHKGMMSLHTGQLGHSGILNHQGTLTTHHHPFFLRQDDGVINHRTAQLMQDENCYEPSDFMGQVQDFRSISYEPQGSQIGFSSGNSQLTPNYAPAMCSEPHCSHGGNHYYSGAFSSSEHGLGNNPIVNGPLGSSLSSSYSPLGLAAGDSLIYFPPATAFQPSHAHGPLTGTPYTHLQGPQTGLLGHRFSSALPTDGLQSGLVSPGSDPLISSAGSSHSMWPGYTLRPHSPHHYLGSLYGNSIPQYQPGISYTPVISGIHATSGSHTPLTGSPGLSLPLAHSVRDAAGGEPQAGPSRTGLALSALPAEQGVFPVGAGIDAPLDVPVPTFVPEDNATCNGSASGYVYRKYSHSNVDYGYGEAPGLSTYLRFLMVRSGDAAQPSQRQLYSPPQPLPYHRVNAKQDAAQPSQRQLYSPPQPLPYHRVNAKQGYDILKFSHKDSADQSSEK